MKGEPVQYSNTLRTVDVESLHKVTMESRVSKVWHAEKLQQTDFRKDISETQI
jgi:hypothetical protein